MARRQIALVVEGDRLLARIMAASMKPRINMTSATMMYMMPIFLWSTLGTHSDNSRRHAPNQVMTPTTDSAPSTVIAAPDAAMAL